MMLKDAPSAPEMIDKCASCQAANHIPAGKNSSFGAAWLLKVLGVDVTWVSPFPRFLDFRTGVFLGISSP